uniref:Uncharacterized protein n=1 Tax=Amblyomma americanum TaxID=6943 RepID=A0A0C9S4B6_AMBAM
MGRRTAAPKGKAVPRQIFLVSCFLIATALERELNYCSVDFLRRMTTFLTLSSCIFQALELCYTGCFFSISFATPAHTWNLACLGCGSSTCLVGLLLAFSSSERRLAGRPWQRNGGICSLQWVPRKKK